MKTYKIFAHPDGRHEAVKQGWSWPGFFFAAFWALVKKMWALGISVFAAFFCLGFFSAIFLPDSEETVNIFMNLASIGLSVVFGMHGNKLRERNLVKRGYQVTPEVIDAGNPEAAVALYLSSQGK